MCDLAETEPSGLKVWREVALSAKQFCLCG